MTNTDNDINALQTRIDELQSLLADVLPELTAYYHQEKVKTDRSAIHQGLSLIHISEPTRPPVTSRMPSSA